MIALEYIAAGLIYAAFLAVTFAMGAYIWQLMADAKSDAEADEQDELEQEIQAAIRQAIARELDTSDPQIGADWAVRETEDGLEIVETRGPTDGKHI